MSQKGTSNRASTGVETLDEILHGGLIKGEMYVVNGTPGAGKTTLALHFLEAGAAAGEKVLCIALAQRVESLEQTAKSVGIDVSAVQMSDLSTATAIKSLTDRQTIFDTSEVELAETMKGIMALLEEHKPTRVVFDGVSHLRLLANNTLNYRQQLFLLRDYMLTNHMTVLMVDSNERFSDDHELVSAAHGVVTLLVETTSHHSDHRYLRVTKMRGSGYEQGMHDVEIGKGGLKVYRSHRYAKGESLADLDSLKIPDMPRRQSGLAPLDEMVGGGLLTGTTCLMLGPSGTGKTSIATLFLCNLAKQGGKASIFLFDESIDTFARRSKGLGMDLEPLVKADRLRMHELSFGNITPGKFANLIDQDVDEWGAGIVAIDTLTGYLNAMPSKARLVAQMHELMKRMNQRGVLTFLMVAQHGVIGLSMEVSVDISYLADTVLLMRHFEVQGEIRQAVSVYKNRYGAHERRICEVLLLPGEIKIVESLGQFSGILSGLPRYVGDQGNAMIEKADASKKDNE